MSLANGLYRTAAGSTVEISGSHSGISHVSFDWLEEPSACIECRVDPYPRKDIDRWILCWECDEHGGGHAELFPDTTRIEGENP